MRIIKSELDTVAVKPSQYPPDTMPEVAFAGRSNVGKSSLLNLLTRLDEHWQQEYGCPRKEEPK